MCAVCLWLETGIILSVRRKALLVGGDALALLVFAAIGRRNHGENLDIGSILSVAWPFLAGKCCSWLLYAKTGLPHLHAAQATTAGIGTYSIQ